MKDQQHILILICKGAAISSIGLLIIDLILLFPDIEIGPVESRLVILSISFFLLYALSSKLPFFLLTTFTLAILITGLLLYPIYADPIDGSDFFVSLISLQVISTIPHIVYHPIKKFKVIIFWIILLIMIFFWSSVVIFQKIEAVDKAELIVLFGEIPRIPFAIMGSYLTLNWIFHRYQLDNYISQNRIELINKDIEKEIKYSKKQQIELIKRNQSLIKLQEELESSNLVLKEKVEKSTHSINEKVELLLRYSYVNSHFLRAPISRIKALINVWDFVNNEEKRKILVSSTEELKSVIKAIGQRNEKNLDYKSTDDYIKSFFKLQ